MIVLKRLCENPELITQALHDPALVGLGLNRMLYEWSHGTEYNPEGIDIFEDEDWDNLIILDACRYDAYKNTTPFDGTPESRESRGSSSGQFITGNFKNKKLHDVVYVSGNRWYLKLREELNCEVHAFHDVERDVVDGYVPSAEAVTEDAVDYADKYPNKRLIVHYMQPHAPYLASDGDRFDYDRDGGGLRGTYLNSSVDRDDLRSAYRKNLKYVLKHVEQLVAEIDGKTVISADHGEMVGDTLHPVPVRWVGHPRGVYTDELVKVPWHVVQREPRRSITPESPKKAQHHDEESVDETLRNLGYKI